MVRLRHILGIGLAVALLAACGDDATTGTDESLPPDDGLDAVPSSRCAAHYSCSATAGGTEIAITNNCATPSDVSIALTASGCRATVQPPCIQNLERGGGPGSVWLLGTNTANNFHVGPFGASTLFEVTHDASGQDWYDLSQNKGFDIGMTVVPPGGDVPYIVCTSQNCPGAYPFGDTKCDASPCLQPNYAAGETGGRFELYLCNGWPDDPRPRELWNTNTPGPLGCDYNQGACISPSSPRCPADDPSHDSRPEDLPCQWGHPVPGKTNPGYGTCPLTCPAPASP